MAGVSAIVFGYGSLVNKASREATLGKSTSGVVIGNLNHCQREFSAISAGNSMLNYKYFTQGWSDDGVELLPAFHPAFLNARISRGASCIGAYIPVDAQGLRDFDARESNYNRIDVTAYVPEGVKLPEGVPVYMYTAKSMSAARVGLAAAMIPSVYLDTVKEAFEEEGLEDDFLNTTDFCGLDIINVGLPHYLKAY